MKRTKEINTTSHKGPRISLKALKACAMWIIETEQSDWKEQIWCGEDIDSHPYTLAFIGLYGKKTFEQHKKRTDQVIEKARGE